LHLTVCDYPLYSHDFAQTTELLLRQLPHQLESLVERHIICVLSYSLDAVLDRLHLALILYQQVKRPLVRIRQNLMQYEALVYVYALGFLLGRLQSGYYLSDYFKFLSLLVDCRLHVFEIVLHDSLLVGELDIVSDSLSDLKALVLAKLRDIIPGL
jgi:hypothetical protein